MMSRLLLSLLYLGATDALHYLEGATTSPEEIFANGTYSYAPQQYILYGIEYDHSAGFSGGNLTFLLLDWPIRIFANIVRPPGQSESWSSSSWSSRILMLRQCCTHYGNLARPRRPQRQPRRDCGAPHSDRGDRGALQTARAESPSGRLRET